MHVSTYISDLLLFGYSILAQGNTVEYSTSEQKIQEQNMAGTTDDDAVKVDPKLADVFVVVDEHAYFKNQDAAFLKAYVLEEIQKKKYKKDKSCLGQVMLNFVVEKNGAVSNYITNPNSKCQTIDADVIEIIKGTSGKWTPAKIKGENVRSFYYLMLKLQ